MQRDPKPSAPAADTRNEGGRRPLEAPASTGDPRLDALNRLLAIVDRLRAPDGCPWDLEQTVHSMAPSLIEEAHEVVEAVEAGQDADVVEEAGDLLMVIVLICRIAADEGRFDLERAARAVGDKLIRRHPHVFGEASVESAPHVIENWERIKQAERAEKGADSSVLAGVPLSMPALQRAFRMGAKAVAAGFRWSDPSGALAKVREECEELEQVFREAGLDRAGTPIAPELGERDRERLEQELGDVLLAAALLGNYLGIDPERATRQALRRFEWRFRHMESRLEGPMSEASLEELLGAWGRAKAEE